MSIEYISKTVWKRHYPCDGYNDYNEIIITRDGIEIDYDVIPWEKIDTARREEQ